VLQSNNVIARLVMRAADHMLTRLVPSLTAQATVCDYEMWQDRDQFGSYCYQRYCCLHPNGQYVCGNWVYIRPVC
jgi:hypothetical protein